MSIFEQAVSVVRQAERIVIGSSLKSTHKHVVTAMDVLLHVPCFIVIGAQLRIAALAFGAFMIPVWWCVISVLMWATDKDGAPHLSANQSWVMAAIFAAGSVLFRLPSRSMRNGVSALHIDKLTAFIRELADDKATLELIQKGVATLDTAGLQRMTRINWLLGLYWGGLVWATAHWVTGTSIATAVQREASTTIFGAFLIFLLFGLATSSYEITVRIVIQTVEFALLQAIDQAEKQASFDAVPEDIEASLVEAQSNENERRLSHEAKSVECSDQNQLA